MSENKYGKTFYEFYRELKENESPVAPTNSAGDGDSGVDLIGGFTYKKADKRRKWWVEKMYARAKGVYKK